MLVDRSASFTTSMLRAARPSTTPASASVPDLKLKTARDALQSLKSRPADGSREGRKAAAQQKLLRLKAQLRQLMVMGGDPKSIARQAAKLAREIGEAAKAYAAAGGVGAGSTVPPRPAVAQPAAAAASEEGVVHAASTEPGSAGPPLAGSPAQQGGNGADEPGGAEAALKAQLQPRPGAGLTAKDPFLEEAKGLVKAVRSLLERELRRARMQDDDDPELAGLAKQGARALGDVEDAARELERGGPAPAEAYAAGAAGVTAVAGDVPASVSVTV